MFTDLLQQFKTGVILLVLITLLTGIVYPSLITVIAQSLFPWQANGSLIENDGKILGSLLIGQQFTQEQYFWGRPSATQPYPYNAASSQGSNLGPSNPQLYADVKARADKLRLSMPQNHTPVPVDLVTTSASGLDPDISVAAAYYQVPRIAKARHLPEDDIRGLIYTLIQKRTFQLLGEPRINVLQLNMWLDTLRNTNVRKTPQS